MYTLNLLYAQKNSERYEQQFSERTLQWFLEDIVITGLTLNHHLEAIWEGIQETVKKSIDDIKVVRTEWELYGQHTEFCWFSLIDSIVSLIDCCLSCEGEAQQDRKTRS